MTMLPLYCSRRSISAAAKPAAPPPTITILSGALPLSLGAGFAGAGRFSLTKTLPSRCSTDQQSIALRAGAASASPVRRLKQA